MKVRITLAVLFSFFVSVNLLGQVQSFPGAVPYSNRPDNTMWLCNSTADQVKEFYLQNIKFEPEKIIPYSDKTSRGIKLYYRHEGSLGWQKYSISISMINLNDCISYYEERNPELLMLPFNGLKSLVGSFDHTTADFKKIYKQYRHLACRLYRETHDSKGNVSNEMAMLLEKYNLTISAVTENLMASTGTVSPVPESKPKTDSWNTWIEFLEELDKIGYVTLIEYSTVNVK